MQLELALLKSLEIVLHALIFLGHYNMRKFLLRSKYYLVVIPFLIVLLLFSGCAGMQIAALETIEAEDQERNKQTTLAMGQRTFDLPLKKLMKAIISAFTNKNLSVITLDKEIGYMVAEGGEFLDPDKVKKIMENRIKRLNDASFAGAFIPTPGNYTVRSTVNLFKKGENKTLVKLGFTSKVEGNMPRKYHTTASGVLPAWYEEIWAEIERSIFIQRELVE